MICRNCNQGVHSLCTPLQAGLLELDCTCLHDERHDRLRAGAALLSTARLAADMGDFKEADRLAQQLRALLDGPKSTGRVINLGSRVKVRPVPAPSHEGPCRPACRDTAEERNEALPAWANERHGTSATLDEALDAAAAGEGEPADHHQQRLRGQ